MSEDETTFVLCLKINEQVWEKVIDFPLAVGTNVVLYEADHINSCDSCKIPEFVVSGHKFFSTGNVLEIELIPHKASMSGTGFCCDLLGSQDWLARTGWYEITRSSSCRTLAKHQNGPALM